VRREENDNERRTKADFAECLRYLAEEMYSDAEKILLVMDNLNTHHLSSLYTIYPLSLQ